MKIMTKLVKYFEMLEKSRGEYDELDNIKIETTSEWYRNNKKCVEKLDIIDKCVEKIITIDEE